MNDHRRKEDAETDITAAALQTAEDCLDAGIDILKVTVLDDQGCGKHLEIITALHRLIADVGGILQCAETNHEYLAHLPTTRAAQADHHAYDAELRTATSTAWRLVGQLAGMRDRLSRPPEHTAAVEG